MAKLTAVLFTVCILYALSQCIHGQSLSKIALEDVLKLSEPGLTRSRRLTTGTKVSGCSYPGVVAVVFNKRLLHTGIYQNNGVRVPDDSLTRMKLVNRLGDLKIYGDDGTSYGTIAKGTLTAVSKGDGSSTIQMSSALPKKTCTTNEAVIFYSKTMSVNTDSCKVVSYGGTTTALNAFSDKLLSTPLVKTPLLSLCSNLMRNVVSLTPNLGKPQASLLEKHFTCSKSASGICSGDIGAPIYCLDRNTRSEVVVGFVSTGTCKANELFLALDLTEGTLPGFSK